MKFLILALLLAVAASAQTPSTQTPSAQTTEPGFTSLWDGKTFNGWKKSTDNPATFRIEDGAIIANGPRCHLYYAGSVQGANFKDFELKIDVMTKPKANGGVYFHTEYQADGWPVKGFEVQVNNTHGDWRKSAGLYAVQDVKDALPDDEWFTEHIVVKGKNVKVFRNGEQVVDWNQPDNWKPPEGMEGRVLGAGTFALQGHDPGSTVYYKNIRVKPL